MAQFMKNIETVQLTWHARLLFCCCCLFSLFLYSWMICVCDLQSYTCTTWGKGVQLWQSVCWGQSDWRDKQSKSEDMPVALCRSAVWERFGFSLSYDKGGKKVGLRANTFATHVVHASSNTSNMSGHQWRHYCSVSMDGPRRRVCNLHSLQSFETASQWWLRQGLNFNKSTLVFRLSDYLGAKKYLERKLSSADNVILYGYKDRIVTFFVYTGLKARALRNIFFFK